MTLGGVVQALNESNWLGLREFPEVKILPKFGWLDINHLVNNGDLRSPRLRMAFHDVSQLSPIVSESGRIDAHAVASNLQQGATLVIDAVDELHSDVREIASELEIAAKAPVQANLYVSYGRGRAGFGTHSDPHDVLVAQVVGEKTWRIFGANAGYPAPTSPIEARTIRAGDALFLQRGWWHQVVADERPSAHLTFAISHLSDSDLLMFASHYLSLQAGVRTCPPQVRGVEQLGMDSIGELDGLIQRPEFRDGFRAWTLRRYISRTVVDLDPGQVPKP